MPGDQDIPVNNPKSLSKPKRRWLYLARILRAAQIVRINRLVRPPSATLTARPGRSAATDRRRARTAATLTRLPPVRLSQERLASLLSRQLKTASHSCH